MKERLTFFQRYERIHGKLFGKKPTRKRFNFEIHIVDGCNLGYKGRFHFSPLASQDSFYPLDEFEADFKRVSELFHGRFSLLLAIGVSLLLELLFAILGPWIGRAFTQNETLLNTVRIVLFIDLALELGRSTNLVVGNTLKSTGDAWFPMVVAVIVTSLIVIGGTYLFGVTLGLGVIGAFIALAADECVRAIIIFFRWASGKWEKQRLVSIQEEPMPALEGQEEA